MKNIKNKFLSYNDLKLPEPYYTDLLPLIKKEFEKSGKTLVILDDDPTGTQTCYNVPVLTQWNVGLLEEELKKKPSIIFILTNSRSFPEHKAVQLTLEVGRNLKKAVQRSGREIVAISRSDSTLRGHFPAEVHAITEALDIKDAIIILLPAFIEGQRLTINDIHYIVEDNKLVPVSETPFAKDAAFGYSHADLKQWVEEKSKGKIKATEVKSISIEDIRNGGPERVSEILIDFDPGTICVANACDARDIEVLALGTILAEEFRKNFIFRTSATLVPIRAGMPSGKKIVKNDLKAVEGKGSLTIVGSYVPKTTEQLNYLISKGKHEVIEIEVNRVLDKRETGNYLNKMIGEIDDILQKEKDVVVYTSRELVKGKDAESSLKINSRISEFLVGLVNGISTRPSFLIAKGGITSNDIASKGLTAAKALILGQVLPGVPVWKMDKKSKFPGLIYVVFPGNVGGKDALSQAFKALK